MRSAICIALILVACVTSSGHLAHPVGNNHAAAANFFGGGNEKVNTATRPPARAVAADFFGVWIEERFESGEKKEGGNFGWELEAEEGGCWELSGQLSYGRLGKVRLRTDKDPVWLDFIDDYQEGKVSIRPGIVKREGEKLIWVWAKEWQGGDPKDIPEWRFRPPSFDVRSSDPWEKMILHRGKERYDRD